jgi:hypothetical protein
MTSEPAMPDRDLSVELLSILERKQALERRQSLGPIRPVLPPDLLGSRSRPDTVSMDTASQWGTHSVRSAPTPPLVPAGSPGLVHHRLPLSAAGIAVIYCPVRPFSSPGFNHNWVL